MEDYVILNSNIRNKIIIYKNTFIDVINITIKKFKNIKLKKYHIEIIKKNQNIDIYLTIEFNQLENINLIQKIYQLKKAINFNMAFLLDSKPNNIIIDF